LLANCSLFFSDTSHRTKASKRRVKAATSPGSWRRGGGHYLAIEHGRIPEDILRAR